MKNLSVIILFLGVGYFTIFAKPIKNHDEFDGRINANGLTESHYTEDASNIVKRDLGYGHSCHGCHQNCNHGCCHHGSYDGEHHCCDAGHEHDQGHHHGGHDHCHDHGYEFYEEWGECGGHKGECCGQHGGEHCRHHEHEHEGCHGCHHGHHGHDTHNNHGYGGYGY